MANAIEIKILTSGSAEAVGAMKDVRVGVDELAEHAERVGGDLSLKVTAPLLAIGGASLKLAMDAVESENLFTVAMGRQADAARSWSEDLREQLGLNEYALRQQVGLFNTMFTSMGLGESAAYNMATGLTELGHDMTSFYNLTGGVDEALQKLQAGITGETEPLKRLGILLDESTVQQYAYRTGIAAAGSQLTEQEKVLARYGSILEQTSQAQGDLARTIDSPTNQLRLMREEVTLVAIELGQVLMPVLADAVSAGMPVVRTVGTLVSTFDELPGPVKASTGVIVGLGVAAGPVIYIVGNLTRTTRGLRAAMVAVRGTQLVTSLGGLAGVAAVGGPLVLGLGAVAGALFLVKQRADESAAAVRAAKEEYLAAIPQMDLGSAWAEIADLERQKTALQADLERHMATKIQHGRISTDSGLFRNADAQVQRTMESLRQVNAALDLATARRDELSQLPAVVIGGTASAEEQKKQVDQLRERASVLDSLYQSIAARGEDTTAVLRAMVSLHGEVAAAIQQQGSALSANRATLSETLNTLGETLLPSVHLDFSAADREFAAFQAEIERRSMRVKIDLGGPTRNQFGGVTLNRTSSASDILLQRASRNADELDPSGLLRVPLKEAADEFDQAGAVAVASFGAMAQAAIAGSAQMEQVVIQSLANIAAAAVGGSTPWGAAITAVGGVIGALFGRRNSREPTPVKLEEYGSRALQQQRDSGPDVVHIQVLDSRDGSLISETEYAMNRGTARDAVVRIPRPGSIR